MMDRLKKVPVREQDPEKRAKNFDEVCYGYDRAEAVAEASRCLSCKNPQCVQHCPVHIQIPAFIAKVREGDFTAAAQVIARDSSLPAICGRVCPQETQCEAKCVRGIKGEAVGIGRLERFVADEHRLHAVVGAERPLGNGHKVAVVGSGPSGLSCAGELAKLGYDVTVFEAFHKSGGVLVYGIPQFRLPKEIVAAEVKNLEDMGVKVCYVTLHVGLGTFRPVKEDEIENHDMHSEFCMVPEETSRIVTETKRTGGRVVAVGTTSCRTLESFAKEDGTLPVSSGWTNIFIYPGYKFKCIDALITNFHLPESTLIMLVSALAGRENVLHAYKVAVEERYRFFSFGDAMLIE